MAANFVERVGVKAGLIRLFEPFVQLEVENEKPQVLCGANISDGLCQTGAISVRTFFAFQNALSDLLGMGFRLHELKSFYHLNYRDDINVSPRPERINRQRSDVLNVAMAIVSGWKQTG
jgi:hypothetical protein